jgi:hypothetical protein
MRELVVTGPGLSGNACMRIIVTASHIYVTALSAGLKVGDIAWCAPHRFALDTAQRLPKAVTANASTTVRPTAQ